ncbi:MAG: hypothetical protein HYY11_06025 [Candidatus Methylomirabilis oxyfera]|nr:hypothetical protein [Candidatus Methylomirabilis oxyfera]
MKRAGVWLVLFVFGVSIAGCATTEPRPDYYAYPQKGQTAEQQSRDQYECQEWAKQQSGYEPGAGTAARGAGIGGVIGALGGAAAGAAIGAATGGIGGVVVGGSGAYAKNKDGYDRAYAACMTGRGYVVR